eukprot:a348825_22.p1 GENE.a348825_22~~a348825_22.p1  ORF type:complete len:349 (-),score=101.09 a348825_22:17-1039(-)
MAAPGPRFKPVSEYPDGAAPARPSHRREPKTPAVAPSTDVKAEPPRAATPPKARYQVSVAGAVTDWEFHWMRLLAQQAVTMDASSVVLEVLEMLPVDWDAHLVAEKRRLGGAAFGHKNVALVLVNDEYIGDSAAVQKWFWDVLQVRNARPFALYVAMGRTAWKKYLGSSLHSHVYIDVQIGDKSVGGPPMRLTFELYDSIAPQTSQNFRTLCAGSSGASYVGSLFHRIMPGGWVQGGDLSPGSPGDAGESAFGGLFPDESFAVAHDRVGILGCANSGPHTNGSQFYVTLQPMPAFDTVFVAFGRLVDGLDVLRTISALPTLNQRPLVDVRVVECGVLTGE